MSKSIVKALILVVPFSFVVGCAAQAGGEPTGETRDPLYCTSCGNIGDPGGYYEAPTCDPGSECCYGGGDDLQDTYRLGTCGQALIQAGCTEPNNTASTFANAVAVDLNSHWWFDVQCPSTMTTVPYACTPWPFRAYFPATDYSGKGAMCMSPTDVGYHHLLVDPNCGSGCYKVIS